MEGIRAGADIAIDETISIAGILVADVPDGVEDGCCDCCKVCIVLCILSIISIIACIVGFFLVLPFGFFAAGRLPNARDLVALPLFRRFLVVFSFPKIGHREVGPACWASLADLLFGNTKESRIRRFLASFPEIKGFSGGQSHQ